MAALLDPDQDLSEQKMETMIEQAFWYLDPRPAVTLVQQIRASCRQVCKEEFQLEFCPPWMLFLHGTGQRHVEDASSQGQAAAPGGDTCREDGRSHLAEF